jgi:endonuclease YncB( thermonuclease family)
MGCKFSKCDNCSFTERQLRASNYQNTPTFQLSRKRQKCKVLKIYDGDTIWVGIYLNGSVVKFNCRMLGYDSPEMRPLKTIENRDSIIIAAKEAKTYLESLINDSIVDISFSGFDKYGRALSSVYIPDPDSNTILCPNKICVNDLMVRKGYGYNYMGGTKQVFK